MMNKFLAVLVLCLVTGFQGAWAGDEENLNDPFERVNRVIFTFNTELDNAILKPVARAYTEVIPEPARNCVGNFFGNLSDVGTGINNALQGKVLEAASDLCRVAINSTIGIFGCFDVAAKVGLVKHKEDFGQTLAVWGVKTGPYVVLPLLGPSSLRDALAFVAVDRKTDLVNYVDPVRTRNQLWALRVVDQRAGLIYASNIIESAALDPYVFVRDAYFQRRNSQVYDGNPPDDQDSSPSAPGAGIEDDRPVAQQFGDFSAQ